MIIVKPVIGLVVLGYAGVRKHYVAKWFLPSISADELRGYSANSMQVSMQVSR
jgi:hypothetical protein